MDRTPWALVVVLVFAGCVDPVTDRTDVATLEDVPAEARVTPDAGDGENPADVEDARDVGARDVPVDESALDAPLDREDVAPVRDVSVDLFDAPREIAGDGDVAVFDALPDTLPDTVTDAAPPPRGLWGYIPPAGAVPSAPPFALPAGSPTRPVMVFDAAARLWTSGVALAREVTYDGREVAPFLVVLDRDGSLLARVSSPGRVVVDSLVTDADGAFVAGAFEGAVSIADVPWNSPGRTEAFVARYSPRGERRWALRLGASLERGGAALSLVDGALALLVAFEGELRAGSRSLSAPSGRRLARVDLSTVGAVTSAIDLGAASGPVVRGTALRGGGTALLNGLDDGSQRLAGFRVDGTERWSRAITRAGALFDPREGVWLTTVTMTDVSRWTWTVASVDVDGNTRWSTTLPPFATAFLDENWWIERVEILREGAALVVAGASGYTQNIPVPFCSLPRWNSVAEYWLDTSGRLLTPPSRGPLVFAGVSEGPGGLPVEAQAGRFAGMAVGPGRVCRLRSVTPAAANALDPVLSWRLACDGLGAGGCLETEFCGGGCSADILNESAHCGACGRACGVGGDGTTGTCLRGACVSQSCSPRRADCDGVTTNGCEVDLASADAHCGACANACPSGAVCRDGRCCRGALCAEAIWSSDGSEGAFAPTRDTTLAAGVHRFTTITVPTGVTVRTTGEGVLDLRATGDVRIDGSFNLHGGVGENGGPGVVASGGGTAGATGSNSGARGPGPGGGGGALARDGGGVAPGRAGPRTYASSVGCYPRPWTLACFDPGIERVGREAYEGAVNVECDLCQPGMCGTAYHSVRAGGGSGGAIGASAMRDLAASATFRPGSGGGASGMPDGAGGGGAGGALRIASPTRITLGGTASLRCDGGAGGTPDGGAGSGGVIVLAAPEVRVLSGAVVSAAGGGTRGGLGRVAVTVDPSRCTLAGTFTPPLRAGCAASASLGYAYVDHGPY